MNGETKKINVPFDIPTTWAWVRLCSLGQIIGGGTPSTEIKAYWDKGTISWITPADMGEHRTKYISFTQRKISELGLSQSSATLMPPNSIVLSSRAPIGYLGITKIPLCTNQGCKSVVPYLQESVEYLYYAIMMAIPNIKERASGTTFKEISGKGFGQTLIPLPPLCEQNRIADLLIQTENKFTIIQSSYNDISRRIEILKYKILDSFFGEHSRYKSYSENMKDLGLLVSGRDLTPDCYNSNNDGIPYLTGASNFENDSVIVNRWTPKPVVISYNGDVLITCKGTIGKTAINQIGKCHIARQIMAFRCGEKLLPEYVKMFFDYRTQELQRASSSLIPGISRDIMLNMVIPLPSIEIQDQIVKNIKTMFAQIERIVS